MHPRAAIPDKVWTKLSAQPLNILWRSAVKTSFIKSEACFSVQVKTAHIFWKLPVGKFLLRDSLVSPDDEAFAVSVNVTALVSADR